MATFQQCRQSNTEPDGVAWNQRATVRWFLTGWRTHRPSPSTSSQRSKFENYRNLSFRGSWRVLWSSPTWWWPRRTNVKLLTQVDQCSVRTTRTSSPSSSLPDKLKKVSLLFCKNITNTYCESRFTIHNFPQSFRLHEEEKEEVLRKDLDMYGDVSCDVWNHGSQLRRVWYITVNHTFTRHHTHEISCVYVTFSCTDLTGNFTMTTLRHSLCRCMYC